MLLFHLHLIQAEFLMKKLAFGIPLFLILKMEIQDNTYGMKKNRSEHLQVEK